MEETLTEILRDLIKEDKLKTQYLNEGYRKGYKDGYYKAIKMVNNKLDILKIVLK